MSCSFLFQLVLSLSLKLILLVSQLKIHVYSYFIPSLVFVPKSTVLWNRIELAPQTSEPDLILLTSGYTDLRHQPAQGEELWHLAALRLAIGYAQHVPRVPRPDRFGRRDAVLPRHGRSPPCPCSLHSGETELPLERKDVQLGTGSCSVTGRVPNAGAVSWWRTTWGRQPLPERNTRWSPPLDPSYKEVEWIQWEQVTFIFLTSSDWPEPLMEHL